MRAQLSFQLLQIATLQEVPLWFGDLMLVMCVVHQNDLPFFLFISQGIGTNLKQAIDKQSYRRY